MVEGEGGVLACSLSASALGMEKEKSHQSEPEPKDSHSTAGRKLKGTGNQRLDECAFYLHVKESESQILKFITFVPKDRYIGAPHSRRQMHCLAHAVYTCLTICANSWSKSSFPRLSNSRHKRQRCQGIWIVLCPGD